MKRSQKCNQKPAGLTQTQCDSDMIAAQLAECSAPPLSGCAPSPYGASLFIHPVRASPSTEMAGSLLTLLAITASLLDPAVPAPQSLTNSYLPPPPVEPKCRIETRTVEEVEEEEVCNTIQVQVKYLPILYNTIHIAVPCLVH